MTLLTVSWSGPQAPFLERHLRPEETNRPNPSRGPLREHARLILVLLVLGIAIALALAGIEAFLLSGIP